MEFLKSLFHAAFSNTSNVLIYIAIVLLFALGILYCIMPVLANRRRLRSAVRNIKAGDDARRSWQEDNFLGKGPLMAHWSAYLNNLFFADGEYHNPSNVEDFINEETVIYGPGRSSFSDALPTLLVSLGFLGTLIGLARGLSGFDMTDSSTAQNSIMTLIPGMRYAFMTSIFGVVGSVAFTLITRMVYGSTEHALRSFYGAMSRYAGVLSVDPLTQVAIYQQEQTAMIKTMVKDINGVFTENITNALQNAVDPINQNLKSFMTVTTKEQMRFLDAVVMRFVDRMDEELNGQLKDFGETLADTNRQQKAAFDAVNAGIEETEQAVRDLRSMQRISQDMVAAISGYLDDLRANARQTEEGYERITRAMDAINAVSAQQNGYLKAVSAMQAEVAGSVNAMTAAVSGFARKLGDGNAEATQAMVKAAGELRAAGKDLEEIHATTSKALEDELRATLDSYRDYVNQFTKRVDYLAKSISDSLSDMPKAVSDTSGQFLDQIDRLTDALEQGQRALNDAVDRMYGQ